MRIDKFIWCVRCYKTRSLATKACAGFKVKLNDAEIKSSKEVKVGDTVAIKYGPIWKQYEVLDIPRSRVGAKLVSQFLKETTPWEDLEMLENIQRENRLNRLEGLRGRPTKRERRNLDRFKDESD